MQQPPTGYDSWIEWAIAYVRRDLETAAPGEIMECELARAELAELKLDRKMLEWMMANCLMPIKFGGIPTRKKIAEAMKGAKQ